MNAALDTGQISLFSDCREPWEVEWQDMPEFILRDLSPKKQLIVNFATLNDMALFAELIGQPLTERTRSIWYPSAEIGHLTNKRYIAKESVE